MSRRWAFVVLAGIGLAAGLSGADGPRPVPAERLAALHRLIARSAGESRWMEIDWHSTVWEARQKAAREGKPLFLWAGSGGAPAAGC